MFTYTVVANLWVAWCYNMELDNLFYIMSYEKIVLIAY
jgi:hypothetical protein